MSRLLLLVLTTLRRSRRRAVLLAFVAGCAGALSSGKSDFKSGRYAEARQTFVASEEESRTWDLGKRAEYALYRGLTHRALGDRNAAGVWLNEAKAIEDANPGTLSPDDLVRLHLGLESTSPANAPGPS